VLVHAAVVAGLLLDAAVVAGLLLEATVVAGLEAAVLAGQDEHGGPGAEQDVVVPAPAAVAAAVQDRHLAGPLVDRDHDPPVRGGQLDLPDRAVVEVVGLDLDDPAVRHGGPGQVPGLLHGDVRRTGSGGEAGSGCPLRPANRRGRHARRQAGHY